MSSKHRPPEVEGGNAKEEQRPLRSDSHVERFFVAASQLREQHHLVDMTVTVGPKSYEAHSPLLAAVSSVFQQRIQYREHSVMDLSGVLTPLGWEAILNFVYAGELEVTPEMAGEILDAAESLGAPRVAEICKMVLTGTETEGRLSPTEEKWETLRRLEELYKEGIGWDLELEAEGDSFRVHRMALACACEFFRGMFTSGMKESRQGEGPLSTHFTSADLGLIICFAYSGTLVGGWDNLLDAAQVALQYQVSGIWELCLDFFHHKMNLESSLDVLSFARAYGLHDLESTAENFVLRNFVDIMATPKFLDLPVNQLVDILSSDAIYILNELEAFQGAIRWLNADQVGRVDCAEKVLHCIRFPLMSSQEIKQVRAEKMMAAPGRLYNIMFESLANLPPGSSKIEQLPCRVRYPQKVIVISGGNTPEKNMATRSSIQDIWFSHCFRSAIGLVKQIEWRPLGYLPGPHFWHAVAVKDNVMYIFGGRHNYGIRGTMCSVFKFDPLAERWEQLADMTSSRSYFPVVFLDGLFYAIGGSNDDVYCLDSVECYEPKTNTWRPCEPLPAPVCGHAACVLDGSIYVSGGNDVSSRCHSTFIRYRPGAPFIPLATMREERAGHAMEVLGGQLYVAGGIYWRDDYEGYGDQLACEVYNPKLDVWLVITPLPQPHVFTASAVLEGELYILGGYSYNTHHNSHLIHCYNPTHDRWVTVGTLPQAYANHKACILKVPASLRRKQESPSDAAILEIPADPE